MTKVITILIIILQYSPQLILLLTDLLYKSSGGSWCAVGLLLKLNYCKVIITKVYFFSISQPKFKIFLEYLYVLETNNNVIFYNIYYEIISYKIISIWHVAVAMISFIVYVYTLPFDRVYSVYIYSSTPSLTHWPILHGLALFSLSCTLVDVCILHNSSKF